MIFELVAGVTIWCLLAHCVFLPYCTCLKRKSKLSKRLEKKDQYRILSGHRGGGGERAENTISAFKNAMAAGCNMMECDVHLTRDKVVVIAHDPCL
jgi:glycerophosphoryl diester phosphodiesterase